MKEKIIINYLDGEQFILPNDSYISISRYRSIIHYKNDCTIIKNDDINYITIGDNIIFIGSEEE